MKRRLYIESIKQLTLPAAVALISGIVLTFATIANLNSAKLSYDAPVAIGAVLWHCCVLAYVTPFVFVFYLFRFLYNKKYADLFYSGDIKSSSAFISILGASLTVSTTVVLICFLLTLAFNTAPLPIDTPVYMFLALMTANILLSAAAVLGVSVSGKLLSGIGFTIIISFAPSLISRGFRTLEILFGNNQYANEEFIYNKNILTALMNYKLFYENVFVNEFIAPAAIVLSFAAAVVLAVIAFAVFTKRTAQPIGTDFVHPFLRHLSATLLAVPFVIAVIQEIYDAVRFNSTVDDFTALIIFLVIFSAYYTVCIGKMSKFGGIVIPIIAAICVSGLLCVGARYIKYFGDEHIEKLPARESLLIGQSSSMYKECDDETADLLYEEYNALSKEDQKRAFNYQYTDGTIELFSKSFWGGKRVTITPTKDKFPKTTEALQEVEK